MKKKTMKNVKVLTSEAVGTVKMELPSACQKCPYRRILQQLLGNWDAGLMKDDGIYKLQQQVRELENQLEGQHPPEKPHETE